MKYATNAAESSAGYAKYATTETSLYNAKNTKQKTHI